MINLNVTRAELALLERIHALHDAFTALPEQRPHDGQEFGILCQRLQDMIAARATYRRVAMERSLPKN